jgi:hypothetical protein
LIAMRKVYQAVVVQDLLYRVSAWYFPAVRAIPVWKIKRIIDKSTKIHGRAAILISGAFKSSSAAAVNLELFLTPISLLIDQIAQDSAILIQRGATGARPDFVRYTMHQHSPQERKKGGWGQREALRWNDGGILNQRETWETWESRKSSVLAQWWARIPGITD